MAGLDAESQSTTQEQEIRELLAAVDAKIRQSGFIEKRNNERRKFRTSCDIRYICQDSDQAMTAIGKTRDLSYGGLGFVSPVHFLRHIPLLITLRLKDGQTKPLNARVAYSRMVREKWFLTGVQFAPVQDLRLAPGSKSAEPEPAADDAASSAEAGPAAPPRSATEDALKMLSAAAAARSFSKERIGKIVMASKMPNHEIRRAAIPVLMQIGGMEAIDPLSQLLGDKNPTVQAEAADALGRLGAQDAVDPLRQLLKHDEEAVALAAAEALARLRDDSGRRVATRVLWADTRLNRRAARIIGLIAGQNFRPNAEGVAAARKYTRQNRL